MSRMPSMIAKCLDVLKFMVDAFSPPKTRHERLMLRAYEEILHRQTRELRVSAAH